MGNLTHTVSGDIASFRTPSRVPIESLKFHFLPKQASGTPSPENPIPIEGWTGLNGKRTSKNIGHIIGYSAASMNSPTANKLLTNSYGTTIGTRDFSLPDTPLVITQEQKSSWDPTSPQSYKNGYFCIGFDNLEFDEYYDFSFEITNVTANPLNVQISDIKLNTPGGGQKSCTEVVNGNILVYKNIKWKQYYSAGNPEYSTRCTLEFRNCGMSFTLSEMMVTPANKSDGVFKPYEGSVIPITFPTSGKNLVNDETTTLKNWTAKDGHRYISTSTDTRDSVSIYVVQYSSNDVVLKNNVKYTPVVIGRNSLTIDVVKGCSKILLKHNGVIRDFGVFIPWDGRVGTYTISANFESIDLSTVGGFIFSDVQIELGNTMTSYEVYSSDNTFYGGYIDPVAGEIVAEYYLARAKKSDFGNKSTPSGTGRDYRQTQSIFPKTASGVEWAIARQQQKFNRGVIANPWSEASYGENIGVVVTQDSMNPVITYMRISEEVYQAMSDSDYAEISYKLRDPIHIPIPVQDMKAFLDHNNFWSDANDITEVTYPITESKDILATRKKAIDFDHTHHKKVRWNQLARDISTSHWRMYSSNALRGTISDGIAECYYVTDKQYSRYVASITTINSISWNADHYYYASYMVKPTYNGNFGIEFARGKQVQAMVYANANEWTRARTKQKANATGYSGLYIPFPDPVGPIDEGYQVKAPFVVDLTLMFGLGNEPQTVAEFEHICELNGIDLTTYQPYDEGSDRWLIVP